MWCVTIADGCTEFGLDTTMSAIVDWFDGLTHRIPPKDQKQSSHAATTLFRTPSPPTAALPYCYGHGKRCVTHVFRDTDPYT